MSRGKYIWIAESDDVADSSFLEKAVSILNQYPHASFCFLGSHCIDEKGNKLSTDFDRWTSKQLRRPYNIGVFDSEDYIKQNLYWRNYIYNASGVVFRKQCFEQIKDLSCFSMRYSGDWLFWIEICRQGNVIRINRKLNYFRQHDNKVSPKAEKEGAYFIEGGRILEYMISLLNLSSYQQYVVGGRTLKRLLKDAKTRVGLKQKALNAHPELFRGGVFSIWLYEFDKIFNISHLHR